MITDRHGAPLAVNVDDAGALAHVLAVPALLRGAPADLTRLARTIGRPEDALRTTLDELPPTTLAAPVAVVPAAVGTEVTALGIPAVMVVPQPRRAYPTGALLGPLLGFSGVATPAEMKRWPDLPLGEVVGRAGIEKQYDAILRGINGQQCMYVTPSGIPVAIGARTAPTPGANLRLALDLSLQRSLADGLVTALRGQRRAIGAAVAMDPHDGQVLAMASVPSYDNNIYGPPADPAALAALAHAEGSPGIEHTTSAAVPPGSVFKLVVAAADLAHGVLPPGTVVPTGGSFTLGGHTFDNWKPMGPMDLVQSLAWSNDVYFYKLAVALGPDRLIETAQALGVGRPTGIDLPGESAGYLGTPTTVRERGATWYGGSTVILGIGQGYLTVTPLQAARWTAGVATGHLVTPRLGLATGPDQRTETALPTPPVTPLPFAGVLDPVREGMRATVTGGTAGRLASLPVPVGAKTGTAQDGSLPSNHYDNWMSAVAPMNAPDIVMTAMVQGPGQGANNAGVVVRDGLAHYLAHQVDIRATASVQNP
jgi:cell division protein FtsI/penicillin-binding protein 2